MSKPHQVRDSFNIWSFIYRTIILLVIYGAFLHFSVSTIYKYLEYRKTSSDLKANLMRYEELFRNYTDALVKSERLKKNPMYQREVLKKSELFIEMDEEPLIIVDQ